jgi:hypothetical protein
MSFLDCLGTARKFRARVVTRGSRGWMHIATSSISAFGESMPCAPRDAYPRLACMPLATFTTTDLNCVTMGVGSSAFVVKKLTGGRFQLKT